MAYKIPHHYLDDPITHRTDDLNFGLFSVAIPTIFTLDAAGNTTAAVGKGFAVGSACLVGFALFGGFIVRCKIAASSRETEGHHADIVDPWAFFGILVGASLPCAFSSMLMKVRRWG